MEPEIEKTNVFRRDSDAEPRSSHSLPRYSPAYTGLFPMLMVSIAVASLMLTLGALLCGWMIDSFGEPGSLGLWGLGAAGGYATRRLSKGPDFRATVVLCVACVLAFVFAEVLWIQGNIKGAEAFGNALGMFPQFLQDFRTAAFVGGVATLFGCMSVHGYTAR